MKTADFFYDLPADRIAQEPVEPRDHSRLLVLNRETGTREHRHFYEIGDFLREGDLLVVNESKVFKARLRGRIAAQSVIEIFLLRPEGEGWIALAKPGRKIAEGRMIQFDEGVTGMVKEKKPDGTIVIVFKNMDADQVLAWSDRCGVVPLPPYIEKPVGDEGRYQTVYAKTVGSVAAPTAGFHFTPELIKKLKAQGIRFASITLHVGLGTFRPIKTETLEEHDIHEEWIDVPDETRTAIRETKERGGRVIAVGTTTVRALESNTSHGMTKLFITPGFDFKVVDALITNFHLPKSSLLVMVSAFAGQKTMLDAYHDAIEKKYRFYSFGDAMLIL